MDKEPNKIVSIIGIGKLGLCFGLNLSKVGYSVIGIDINEDYVEQLKNKEFDSSEAYVNDYLDKYPFEYSTNIEDALKADTIFVIVATPSTQDHKYDHFAIDAIADSLMELGIQKERKDLILNCTTFPGYVETLQTKLKSYNYKVSYNPEFIAQGTIIHDQQYCDTILIGGADQYAAELIKGIYSSFVLSSPSYHVMKATEAELTKIAMNCFLTTKISFANMIGDIAKKLDCDYEPILFAIGSDSRVGNKYLNYGFGFGGPCFPRDNRALSKCADEVGISAEISKATDIMNQKHLQYQIEDFIHKNPDKTKSVEIEYITYKKESVSIEESQQLKFAKALCDLGYTIKVLYEREDSPKFKNIIKQ